MTKNRSYQQLHSKFKENKSKIVNNTKEFEEEISKLKEENAKLTKFYSEYKHLEEKLLKSKELINTLLKELNYYKDRSVLGNITELDFNLEAITLMSHSKLLEAQLNSVQGKLNNLAVKMYKYEHECTCGLNSTKSVSC